MLYRVSLRQMEYFVAAAKCGTIAAASSQIHVSSPSISAAIAHIEAELGVQLFVRHPSKGLSLTPIGSIALQHCEDLLERSSRLYEISANSSNSIEGPLRVGCFQSLAPLVAPEVIFGFGRAFEKVNVEMIEGDQSVLMDKLYSIEIDLAITYDLQVPEDVSFETLATLPPYALLGELHPLAQQATISLEELAPLPMVLLDLPMSRQYFLSIFAKQGLTPNIVARSRSEEVVRSMVANGIGYALFNVRPKSFLALDGKRTVRLRLVGEHRPMLLGLASYKPVRQSRLVQVFMQRCRSYISDQYIPGMSAPSFFDPRLATPPADEAPSVIPFSKGTRA